MDLESNHLHREDFNLICTPREFQLVPQDSDKLYDKSLHFYGPFIREIQNGKRIYNFNKLS